MKVSIVMPAYNAAKTIEESIQSVLQQTFSDWELIIINDCSTDNTAQIIDKYCVKDSRIICLLNEQNSGVAASRNNAIKVAKGEWIAFLDADDIWDKTKLEKQIVQISANKDIFISYTASAFMNHDGKRYSYVMPAEEKVDYEMLLRKNIMSCSSVMINADLMKTIEMPSDSMHEDYYCWLIFLKQGYFGYGINEPLLMYRMGRNTKSSSRLKSARMNFNTYRAVGYSWILALYYMCRYALHSVEKRRKICSCPR